MPNHLINESSPYLLQHADNPVEWYPWGEAAFKRAREEDKPILLSIGYSACHWCHVMAHESFENQAIAEIMNKNFINIKVDREERPDIDSLYMSAVQILSGGSGWPLTVFLTPDGKPFYGGTYFAPQDRHGLPGLPAVLNMVTVSYRENRERIDSVSGQLVDILSTLGKASIPRSVSAEILDGAYETFSSSFDSENGGFGTAPKFPQAILLDFLLRYYHRSKNKTALHMVELTLDKMARGGIYDHLGGGFHRYAVDDKWLVPHFEKMLYDNALLSSVYLDAFLITHKSKYKYVVTGIIDYVLREMCSSEGGFYSSQDADSGGVEGAYYIWTGNEIEEVLDSDTADCIAKHYGIIKNGNFESRNILHIADNKSRVRDKTIEAAGKVLLKKREERIPPGRDEKILASWNGYMLSGIARAAAVFNRKDYMKAAVSCGNFIIDSMISNSSLKHVFKDGEAKIDGHLQDYSSVINGFLTLHEATLDIKWLKQAISLADTMIDKFWAEDERLFYDTDGTQNGLIIRPRHIYDDVLPSGISQASMVLLKLSVIAGNERYRNIAMHNIQSIAEFIRRNPAGFAYWACTVDFYLSAVKEIAVISGSDSKKLSKIAQILNSLYLPDKVIAACNNNESPDVQGIALLQDKALINGNTAVSICENYTCKEPIIDIEKLKELLSRYE